MGPQTGSRTQQRLGHVLLGGLLAFSAATLPAATFTVDSTGDEPDAAINGTCATGGGACTLRAALEEANAAAGPHTIGFDVPGTGPHTILLGSRLPIISRNGVTIDGYTQPGAQPNTHVSGPLDAVIQIELTSGLSFCIEIIANDVVVRGLAVYDCGSGILAVNGFGAATSGVQIEGNYIGTDASGMVAMPNGTGVALGFSQGGSMSVTVGGTTPAARNLISGNTIGIQTTSNFNGTVAATIQGNLIGLDAAGGPLPNGRGVDLNGGGPTNGTIGGAAEGAGNEIAWNTIVGVSIPSPTSRATIRNNSFHDNGGLGIDLGGNGVTANDADDADTGPSDLQNFPIVSSAQPLPAGGTSGTRIQGVLHSAADTTYDLDFYENPACASFPREFLEGETYIGSGPVTTDSSGVGVFDILVPVVVATGARVSATATEPGGRTSEFSQRIPFTTTVVSGPPEGGTNMTLTGTDFLDGATATFGGVPAANPSVTSFQQMTLTTPALLAGTVYDIAVLNTDGSAGTLPKGFVADFLDVPGGHQFYSFVTTLVSNAITAGVGGGNYGVAQDTLRQQMAVFLLKAKYGLCYTPPPCSVPVFDDVPCNLSFAPWINELVAQGIAGGCAGANNYCPGQPVLRQQMAVLLLRTLEGTGYAPPDCTVESFSDVPCDNPFADWIYELVARNITAGCGGGNYCPAGSASRGQMAVFVTKTFGLQ